MYSACQFELATFWVCSNHKCLCCFQSLHCVPLFVTLWHKRLLCPRLSPGVGSDSCLLNWWCYLTISFLLPSSPFTFNPSQHQDLFQWVGFLHQVAKALELQFQHQSFQWIFMVYFLYNGLVGSPCITRDSKESSPALQFKSMTSSAVSLLYGSTLTSIHDYWKNPQLWLHEPWLVKRCRFLTCCLEFSELSFQGERTFLFCHCGHHLH